MYMCGRKVVVVVCINSMHACEPKQLQARAVRSLLSVCLFPFSFSLAACRAARAAAMPVECRILIVMPGLLISIIFILSAARLQQQQQSAQQCSSAAVCINIFCIRSREKRFPHTPKMIVLINGIFLE